MFRLPFSRPYLKRLCVEKCNKILATRFYKSFFLLFFAPQIREVSEWLKEQAWKVCMWVTASRVVIVTGKQATKKRQQLAGKAVQTYEKGTKALEDALRNANRPGPIQTNY